MGIRIYTCTMTEELTAHKRYQKQQSLLNNSHREKVINQLLVYQGIIAKPNFMKSKMCTFETTHVLTCKSLNTDAHVYSCSRKSCGMLAWGNTALSGNSGPVEATLLMYMVSKHTSHCLRPRLTQLGKVLMQDICTNDI
jgi:hypothetical protein